MSVPFWGRLRCSALLATLAAICCAAGSVASGVPATSTRANKAAQLRTDLARVKARIAEKRAQIRRVRRTEHHIVGEIESVEGQLLSTEARLGAIRNRLGQIRRRHAILTARIGATKRRLGLRRRVLALRVRQTYQQGRDGFVHVLLASRSMHDYMSRSYYIEKIVDSDTRLIGAIRADELQLRQDLDELARQAVEQRALEAELVAKQAQYREYVDRKRDILADVQSQREELARSLDVLEEASRDITARIRAMQATPRGRARLLRPWTGRFIRPVSGGITSSFGMRRHPILGRRRMHTGVDMSASYGEAIHAAAGGDVVMAGYMRGYGNTVIIDHGGGVTTLYAHCSALIVGEGQSVRQGQTVARVGSTGLSTGPHLHFEVRHNGTPVSPL